MLISDQVGYYLEVLSLIYKLVHKQTQALIEKLFPHCPCSGRLHLTKPSDDLATLGGRSKLLVLLLFSLANFILCPLARRR